MKLEKRAKWGRLRKHFCPTEVSYEEHQAWLKKKLGKYPGLLKERYWRLNNLYWIQDEAGESVLFRMRPQQEDLYLRMWFLNIVLKSRQHGFSTFILIFMLDTSFWNNDLSTGTIAHTKDDVKKLFRTKVRYPYERLPEMFRERNPASQDTANELIFANGSSISVGMSMRSATLQILHISEYGKICAKYPEKAKEIKSGALNTIHSGQMIFIESTAEGRSGDFYEKTKRSKSRHDSKRTLSKLQFKFFFYPWWNDKKNVLDPRTVQVSAKLRRYFKKLREIEGIKLTPGQMAWYAAKEEQLDDLIYREHPSTPEEAFMGSTEGTFYGRIMVMIRRNGQIQPYLPIEPAIPIDTTWDLGKNDNNAIWFVQYIKQIGMHRWLHYYENHDYGLDHYWEYLKEFREKHGIFFGNHYLPHDVEVSEQTRTVGYTRQDYLEDMGMRDIIVVERVPQIIDGIEAVRQILPVSQFSEQGCHQGIVHLENYRKDFDEKTQTFRDAPKKNTEAGHGADSFRQYCQGWKPEITYRSRKKNRNWRTA